MNPFLHNTVATVQPPACAAAAGALPGASPGASPRMPARRRGRWPGAVGRLALAAGLALAILPAHALDVNSATADQLRTVRGVGPKTAETIVKERERGGRFESMEDLSDRVRGIGPRKAQALQAAGLSVGPGTGTPGVRPASGAAAGGRKSKDASNGRSTQRGPR
ncbi:Helix-hairpin-helix DNA-binding motif class 1 domain-containing protein [Bordetella sputigena]|uniref:ComEA family DNA-binding protein n=1 Tax=Bordetella sputigena TaxID=1416810 RepID=UPI0039EEC854